ncbi:MAG: glycosyltransferase family 4 protein [Bacillota bacterium]
MKILVITQYYWPETFHINEVTKGLMDLGHEVTVLTGLPNYPQGHFFSGYGLFGPFRENRNGIRILRVPILPRGRRSGLRLALNYFSFAFNASLLLPFLALGRPDVVLIYQASPVTAAIPALVLRCLKHVPSVLWVQDLWPESLTATGAVSSPTILSWVERLVRFIYLHSDLILVKSRGFETQIRRIAGSAPTVRYFPDWAGPADAYIEEHTPFPSLPRGFRVMFAGNIGVAQDFGTILSAAERLRSYEDIHWLIVGDGSQRTWVEERIRLGRLQSVHLLGQFPAEMMPRFFSEADVLLVTLRNDDAFALTVPGKLRTYLASGKPIVAALPGEGAELVRGAGAGIVCLPGDPDSLAASVLTMYEMPVGKRAAMGSRGRAFYRENYDRKTLLTRLERWLVEVAHGTSDGSAAAAG